MTEIVAHRGSRINRPENTLTAFEEAIRVGADGIELDVHLSKDGEVVVIHDETVDRTTNGSGRVRHLTIAELKELDAGSWFDVAFTGEKIPTLLEVLELLERTGFRGSLNIEFKTDFHPYPNMEKKVQVLLDKKDWPFDIMYSSFSLRALLRMHRLDPTAEVAYLVKKSRFLVLLGRILPWITTLHLSYKWYFHNQSTYKKGVRLWTVNNEEVMKKAFRSDVRAIITDKPEEAIRLRSQVKRD
ncbi:glycerophosphodiester phosphodiesterase [Streptococcus minor]|uniref:Glycerophosphodiester phosphodiesterase n=1 Tax=Streptococcus minor TaxID=229549 RepID=A0A3P1VEW4_9STRE|nr:glycerophosphodiester phosphodiesterase [Streptococcus minor]RRD31960.1 glycerophosphodiester phosphodiesterase [Streptococcus minor]